jgi:hypothetical protein
MDGDGGISPSDKTFGADLLAGMQKKEDDAAAEAKEGSGLSAATLPPQGGSDDEVAAAAPSGGGGSSEPYIIPANDYARPRFGITSDIFNQPVSIA